MKQKEEAAKRREDEMRDLLSKVMHLIFLIITLITREDVKHHESYSLNNVSCLKFD